MDAWRVAGECPVPNFSITALVALFRPLGICERLFCNLEELCELNRWVGEYGPELGGAAHGARRYICSNLTLSDES
jgi:hypothetical protein